jgi:hypothetical protein
MSKERDVRKRRNQQPAASGRPKPDSLHRDSWLRYLEALTTDDSGVLRVNGTPLKDKHTRALFRWRNEGGYPSFFLADDILTHCGLHINDFLQFCKDEELEAWASGQPDWERGFSAV